MAINLTVFCDRAHALRVVGHDQRGHSEEIGTMADVFGSRIALIRVGDAQGSDSERGYEWYPLTIDGDKVAELRDDASGMTVHMSRFLSMFQRPEAE